MTALFCALLLVAGTLGGDMARRRANPEQLQERLIRIRKWLGEGLTYKEIAQHEGVKPGTIRETIRRHDGASYLYSKTCVLVGCDVEFGSTDARALYCCRRHEKRGTERARLGAVVEVLLCRLPECERPVVTVNKTRKFCSRKHGNRFDARRRIGYYDKLVNKTACVACGWWGPGIESHHIKPKHKGGSDHPTNLAWMCQNCHVLLHAGLATFNHRREFVDLREEMRAKEIARRKVWDE